MLYQINNNKLSLTVSDHGAEIKSIKFNNEERIHDSNPKYWNRSAPLLFPCIGTITNGSSIINDKPYNLPKHGFLRDQDFILSNQTSDTLEFTFTSNEETKKIYPYDFELIVSYIVNDDTVTSNVNIINKSNEVMLYNFGLHPAFKTPIREDETFEDYKFITKSLKDHPVYKVELSNGTIDFREVMRTINFKEPLPLNYEDYKYDALVFDNIDFDELTLTNKDETHGVTFKFTNFPMLGIWTPYPKDAPFICIEPWIGCADPTVHDGLFEHKTHVQKINPSSSNTIKYSLKFF